ncbi:MAG TPA: metalloregulator ArsR/SmtB family transcription factor [Propionibacteriaceae bacterium]
MTQGVLEVVVEPNRRRILDTLRQGERSVNELVAVLGLAQPTVSKHLKTLREAGLVVVRPDAQRRWYQLRPEPLRELDAWLHPYRQAWSERLDALGRHLDASAGPDEQSEHDVTANGEGT